MKKTFFILRHGEAVTADGGADFSRRLTVAGQRQVKLSAQSILRVGAPQRIIASGAERTQQTAQIALDVLGDNNIKTDFDANLYHATPDDWLDYLQQCDEATSTVLLIGHNPALSQLVTQLSNRLLQLPPSGLVAFGLDETWAQVHKCQLLGVFFPEDNLPPLASLPSNCFGSIN